MVEIRSEIEQREDIYSLLMETIPKAFYKKPSEWSSEKRKLSSAFSPKPGPIDWSYSPYMVEIIDNFSPDSPVREVAVMKGHQLGFTQLGLEGIIGYIIDESPGPVLYTSADKKMTEENMETRVDSMLESANLLDKIRPMVQKKHSHKTGDTKSKKEFDGGVLFARGLVNPNGFRQIGAKYILVDEIDGVSNFTVQGNTISNVRTRADAFEKVRKILWISTPLRAVTSNIYRLFRDGDQRYFYMPCPRCGEHQALFWRGELKDGKYVDDEIYNLKFEREGGLIIPDSIHYCCRKCGGSIWEYEKYTMLNAGLWVPQVERPKTRDMRSYSINGLYSYFHTWLKICDNFLGIGKDKEKLRSFMNNECGLPMADVIKEVNVTKLYENCREYPPGVVPNQISVADGNGLIALLLCSVDVNAGEDDQQAYLAVTVNGICKNGQRYEIGKCYIHGSIEKDGNAWDALRWILEKHRFESDDGKTYRITLCGCDSGHETEAVYYFCNNCSVAVPLKGSPNRKTWKDTFNETKMVRATLYSVDTTFYKNAIADYCSLEWKGQPMVQPHDYMNFPNDKHFGGFEKLGLQDLFGVSITDGGYNEKHFTTYESEEPIYQEDADGNMTIIGWEKKHSRAYNHFWDTVVYFYALIDILAYRVHKKLKMKDVDKIRFLVFMCEFLEENGYPFGEWEISEDE